MPEKNKIIFIFAVIIAIIAIFIAGYLFFYKGKTNNSAVKENNAVAKKCSKVTAMPEIKGLAYADARAKIISAGWAPFQTLANDSYDIGFEPLKSVWALGYHEADACSGTGEAPCRFDFKDKCNNLLYVTTVGVFNSIDGAHVAGYVIK